MGSQDSCSQKLISLDLGSSEAPETIDRISWLAYAAFYALIANVPYWFASYEFGFWHLGWFCIQYAAVGLLALVVPRFASALLLFGVIAADLLDGVCGSFALPIREAAANVGALRAFTISRMICSVLTLMLTLIVVSAAGRLSRGLHSRRSRLRVAMALAAFMCFVVGADVLSIRLATGRLPVTLRSSTRTDGADLRLGRAPRFARIPVIRLVRSEISDLRQSADEKKVAATATSTPSAAEIGLRTAGVPSQIGTGEFPNVVLIVVESWGLANGVLKDAVVQPYSQSELADRYNVIQGTVPFNGATVAGEARELCGRSMGYHIVNATAVETRSCLPMRLAALGYYNIALHGMTGNMFDRSKWYATIGFQERWFNEQFKQAGLPDCEGAFDGTCDADVAAWIGRRLGQRSPRPYFVHWMTLNSHLPVFVPAPLSNPAPCLQTDSLTPNTPLCSWYQLITNVHRSVAELATGNLARPTVFIIVGDHAPPFADPALQERFSQSDVPYVVLLPRTEQIPSRTVMAHIALTSSTGSAKRSIQTP